MKKLEEWWADYSALKDKEGSSEQKEPEETSVDTTEAPAGEETIEVKVEAKEDSKLSYIKALAFSTHLVHLLNQAMCDNEEEYKEQAKSLAIKLAEIMEEL